MTNDDAIPRSGRWWLDSALARMAFGNATAMQGAGDTAAADAVLLFDLRDPGQREFGDYELIEAIGRGGMGVVYRARQRNLDREVAIKLLSAGPWASDEFVASFRSEAQNAARLQHPNIVGVHEMGDHGGLVFYAMQLVRGQSLSQRLEAERRMRPRVAAQLLQRIAEAVHYAHRLGVLHLDLKPGNILIDENGEPLIADFGLARRLERALGVANERVCGTPSYMAPEQAQVQRLELSPATDVYGLGAVLYEMLTGVPPFLAGDPLATLQSVLQGPLVPPREHDPMLPRDLEAIVLHCLQREPHRRYASAGALADDLGNFLAGRPVQVRPLGALHRLTRFAQREPRLAGTTAVAMLALAVGLSISLWLWRSAESNARQASEVNRFLNEDVLAAADPYQLGWDPERLTVPDLLENAESKLDHGLVDQPVARAQIGLSLGRAYFGMGLWSKARERLEKARRDARNALGADAPLTLEVEQQLGLTATYDARYDEAQAVYAHLIDARRRQAGWDAPETIAARRGEALLLYETDRFGAATRALEALRIAARANAPAQLADIEWTLSDLYTETNRWDEAEALVRSVLARSRAQLGPHHPQYLWETTSLGDMLMMRGRWDEAQAVFQTMRGELERSLGPLHPKTLTAVHYLGVIRLERGEPAQALPLLRAALQGRIRVQGEDHKWTQYSMNRVGQALVALHRPREAVATLGRALDLATRAGRRRQAYVLLILDNLARAELLLGNVPRAAGYLDEALATAKATLPGNNVRRAMLERTAGELDAVRGEPRQALRHYRYAERVFVQGFGPQHPWARDLRGRIARLEAPRPALARGGRRGAGIA